MFAHDPRALHGPMFTPDPLDWNHPHAEGLVGLWLPLAPWDGGKAICDLGGRFPATFTGALTWGRNPVGAGVSGFTTSNYPSLDAAAPKMTGTYPVSLAALVTLAANGVATTAISFGNTGSNAACSITLNVAAVADTANWFISNGAVSTNVLGTGLTFADGRPHVFQGITYSATDHRAYLDGRQAASSSTSVTVPALNCGTIGLLRRSTTVNPFLGSVAAVAAWAGRVPDPAGLARDWLAGNFSVVRRRPGRLALYPVPPSVVVARRPRSYRVGSRSAVR